MPEPITYQMFLNWLDHPVTRKLHEALKQAKQESLETLGDFLRGPQEQPSDDRLRGFIRGIEVVLEWEAVEPPQAKEKEV